MSPPHPPFAVQAGEGSVLETPTGDRAVVKADAAQTNGSMTVIELVIGPKQGPALHEHRNDDELWFVLDGEFRFKVGEVMLQASIGGMAYGPRGTPHCFQNVGDEPGRLLIVTTPAGLERFFRDFAAGSPAGPAAPETLAELGLAHGLEFRGPPLGVSDPI
ncbi:cupin domain-containing protein [Egicoccus sp. AB-alg2]|uniref:cupin domain-containing protein n=1 Tax=Egicoccus sp. AB-alg2 TaxID=3242693 RepID=UPI00359EB2CA